MEQEACRPTAETERVPVTPHEAILLDTAVWINVDDNDGSVIYSGEEICDGALLDSRAVELLKRYDGFVHSLE